LRPINLARDILVQAGFDPQTAGSEPDTPAETASAAVPNSLPVEEEIPTSIAAPPETPAPVPPTPDAMVTYVSRVDYCRTGPVYPVGTRIVLTREAPYLESYEVLDSLGYTGKSDSAGRFSWFFARAFIRAGETVEIIGPFVENGDCDLWPVRDLWEDGTVHEVYVDEWDLRPAELESPCHCPSLEPSAAR
jgi:hypothetical protein